MGTWGYEEMKIMADIALLPYRNPASPGTYAIFCLPEI
jgi:hypothetical protein